MSYLDRVKAKWPLRIHLPIGTHMPFYCTASGKMYLSTLNEAFAALSGAVGLEPPRARTITDRERLHEEIAVAADRVISLPAYPASGSGSMRRGLYADSGGERGALLAT